MASAATYEVLSDLNGEEEVPERYKMPEFLRPNMVGLLPSSEVPVVDLGAMERERVVSAITEACKEWGFCQVLNHGVPSPLIHEVTSLTNHFFSLPSQDKARASEAGYQGVSTSIKDIGALWIEGITLHVFPLSNSNLHSFANTVTWPNHTNPTHFCESISKLTEELDMLKERLLEVMAEGLGIDPHFFNDELQKSGKSMSDIRLNYYPTCPDPTKTLGTLPHTDPTLLTILYQDSGNGLQVQSKDGRWHLIEYKKDSLVFFVNDALQAWSNGIFMASIHRAIVNKTNNRISFLLSSVPPMDMIIRPAPQLVDENHPARYRPFRFSDYVDIIRERGAFPLEGGIRGMDAFVGISNTPAIVKDS